MASERPRLLSPPTRVSLPPNPTLARQHGLPLNRDMIVSTSGDVLVLSQGISPEERELMQERYPRNRLHFVDRREDIQAFMQERPNSSFSLFTDERLPYARGVVMEALGKNPPLATQRAEFLFDLRASQARAGVRPIEPPSSPSGRTRVAPAKNDSPGSWIADFFRGGPSN
jgi:hypothetical protein